MARRAPARPRGFYPPPRPRPASARRWPRSRGAALRVTRPGGRDRAGRGLSLSLGPEGSPASPAGGGGGGGGGGTEAVAPARAAARASSESSAPSRAAAGPRRRREGPRLLGFCSVIRRAPPRSALLAGPGRRGGVGARPRKPGKDLCRVLQLLPGVQTQNRLRTAVVHEEGAWQLKIQLWECRKKWSQKNRR
ncbi:translation initiation factor IF-2-like isoform X2 [Trachypithecus francoisi]|uniref:translation initiation factor IF-2-like isoform X2 n=1 Tax=Trachypithecus francoisi TaxID=54180 RepID=UPI00141BE43B|nr:translation initiation factor IF-2-like isoform X2 [Trachypithecus francoisi]